MSINIRLGGQDLPGVLEDTTAGRDFASLLPLTLSLSDFNSSERIADLPRRLDTADAPPGATPRAGDIMYYAPWGNLALFYRGAGYAAGLVTLGHLEGQAADVLADLNEGANVTITLG